MKYLRKRLEVEAEVFYIGDLTGLSDIPAIPNKIEILGTYYDIKGNIPMLYLEIPTLDGKVIRVDHLDYIVREPSGELYPLKPVVFHKTYESIRF